MYLFSAKSRILKRKKKIFVHTNKTCTQKIIDKQLSSIIFHHIFTVYIYDVTHYEMLVSGDDEDEKDADDLEMMMRNLMFVNGFFYYFHELRRERTLFLSSLKLETI